MALPPAITRAGFTDMAQMRVPRQLNGRRRLMIGTAGGPNTGKSEFIWSIPGPGISVCVDRGFEAALNNPEPPSSRRSDWAGKVIPVPLNQGGRNKEEYAQYWMALKTEIYRAAEIPEVAAIAVDGDSDSYELQSLAEHGTLTGVYPTTKYGPLKAARRAFYNRLFDSGKTIICTNKITDEYIDAVGPDGKVIMDPEKPGEVKRIKSGKKERAGFKDYEFLFQLQLMHLYDPPARISVEVTPKERLAAMREGREPGLTATPPRWGLRIDMCKHNRRLEGDELWDEDCTFKGLVQHCFPNVDLKEWGF